MKIIFCYLVKTCQIDCCFLFDDVGCMKMPYYTIGGGIDEVDVDYFLEAGRRK